jgi:two-component system nitrate/nitrite response regulator NarL
VTLCALIIDDHGVLADGLAMALQAEGLPAKVHVPTSAEGILAAVAEERPRLVLLDLDLGLERGSGADLVAPLRDLGPSVLVLTGSTDRLVHARCLEAGAAGVASKAESFERLLDSVRRTAQGQLAMGRLQREELLDELRRHRADRSDRLAPFERLSPKEASVLLALAEGRSAEAIARASFVSLPTVRTQIRGILVKLGVSSQLAAVGMALERGWLEEMRSRQSQGAG